MDLQKMGNKFSTSLQQANDLMGSMDIGNSSNPFHKQRFSKKPSVFDSEESFSSSSFMSEKSDVDVNQTRNR